MCVLRTRSPGCSCCVCDDDLCLEEQNSRPCLDSLFLKAALITSCSCPRVGDPNHRDSSPFKRLRSARAVLNHSPLDLPTHMQPLTYVHANTNFGLILPRWFNWTLSASSLCYVLMWTIPLCWNPLSLPVRQQSKTATGVSKFCFFIKSDTRRLSGRTQHLGNLSLF